MFSRNVIQFSNQSPSQLTMTHHILIIDSQVDDYQQLVAGAKPGFEVFVLDAHRNGIEQITEILNASRLSPHASLSLHIVSHGSPGTLYLGNSQLSLDTLERYAEQLQSWFTPHPSPLTPHALYLYGCNIAAGDAGEEFIQQLQDLIHVEISASTKAVGYQNWQLDVPTKTNVDLAFTSTVTATYTSVFSVDEGFETGNFNQLPWVFSGNQGWTITGNSASGTFAATSGDIGDTQSSTMSVTLNVLAGNISFAWGVSSETGWDYLRFYIDGVQQSAIDGNRGYQTVSFPVSAGSHIFTWSYTKDGSVSTGSDSGFVDNIDFPLPNVAPTITSANAVNVEENSTGVVLDVNATDAEGNPISYSITGGVDAAQFSINNSTGELSFVSSPNYEDPSDSNDDNIYEVQVTANDGNGGTIAQTINVTVTDVNDAPEAGGGRALTTIDNESVWNGSDAINSFGESDTATYGQTFTVPSDGSGTILNSFSFYINDSLNPDFVEFAAYVMAWDGSKATGSILYQSAPQSTVGSAGYELFTFDTGGLELLAGQQYVAFVNASNQFDSSTGTGTMGAIGNNPYTGGSFVYLNNGSNFGSLTTTSWTTFLSNHDAAGTFEFSTPTPDLTVTEDDDATNLNLLIGASDEDGDALNVIGLILIDGDDSGVTVNGNSLDIDPSAYSYLAEGESEVITFSYDISDGNGGAVAQTATITINGVNDVPEITSSNTAEVEENSTAVTTVVVTDAEGDPISYSITGGADAAQFSIDSSTGELSFVSSPNYEDPSDSNDDNIYEVQVTANDGNGGTTAQTTNVTVTNVNDAPVIASSFRVAIVSEILLGDTAGFQATLAQLNDDTYFDFDATLVSFADVDTVAELNQYDAVIIGNNGYGQIMNATFASALRTWVEAGGGLVSSGWIVYGDQNNPDIDAVVPVNTVADHNYYFGAPLQPNSTVHPVTEGVSSFTIGDYNEFPVGGIDAGATVLATTYSSPTVVIGEPGLGRSVYLGPLYSGTSSFYNTTDLRSGEADQLLEQAVAWAVGDGSGPIGETVTEDDTLLTVDLLAGASDEDGDVLNVTNLTLTDGDDSGVTVNGNSLDIDPSAYSYLAEGESEVITFSYDISDGNGGAVAQTATITINGVNDVPEITSSNTAEVEENSTAVTTVVVTDAEGDPISYSITGGADAAQFSIDSSTGELSFVSSSNYEDPSDSNDDNIYEVQVTANDGNGGTIAQTINVTVTDVNDAPEAGGGGALTTINNESVWDGSQAVDSFGESNTATCGQTFTVPNDGSSTILSSFSFYINDFLNPDFVEFVAYVMAWDGSKATGSILYQSAPQSTVGSAGFELFTFDTGRLELVAGQQYVAFINASNQFDGSNGTGLMGAVGGNPYAGGDFVFLNNGSDFGSLTTTDWHSFLSVFDAAGTFEFEIETPDLTVTEDDNVTSLDLLTGASDEDSDILNVTNLSLTIGDDAGVTINGNSLEIDPSVYNALGTGESEVITYSYDISDGNGGTLARTTTITINGVNDVPVFTSSATPTLAENSTVATTVVATDADGDPISYSISGGVDAALFEVDATTGELSFITAPDFENPTDDNGDNLYEVTVSASDGSEATTQTLSVSVVDLSNGVTDFNNDNQPDVVWRRPSTGQTNIWFTDGQNKIGGGPAGATIENPNWLTVGVGDFDKDGKRDDILWRNVSSGANVIWFMDGINKVGNATLDPIGTNWEVQGVGDFEHQDYTDDILWRNQSTGQTVVWTMDGTTKTGTINFGTLGTAWKAQGVGDFEANNFVDDIVWRNYTTGQTIVWETDGQQKTGSFALDTVGTNWKIDGVGDLDGDKIVDDLLWYNTSNNAVVTWFIDNGAKVTSSTIGAPSNGWDAVL